MGDYLGLIIALAIGLPLLALAALIDWRARSRRRAELAAPTERRLAAVDRHAPNYLSQEAVDAMPLPGADRAPSPKPPGGQKFNFGYAARDFATAADRAELTNARVLLCSQPIGSIRELLTPLAAASPTQPLVIVAPGFDPVVLATLCANRRALKTAVVAAIVKATEMSQLAALVGGEPLTTADLQAGYVPDSAIGVAATWISNPNNSWITGFEPEPKVRV